MKNPDPEDEAFEELALKQGHWQHTSGWRKKQIQEPRMTDKEVMKLALEALERNDYLGYQANQKAITALKEALAQRTEQNFCSRCGKRTPDLITIHTCTPPKENT